MRFKLTLFLLLANLAVFFVLWRLNQPPEIPPRAAGPIPKENFEIDHILIEDHAPNASAPREMTKDRDGVWHLIKPVEWLANEFAMQDLISHLQLPDEEANFSVDDMKKGDRTLKDYGLDKPVVEITVQAGERKEQLYIGTPTENGNRLYVMNPADGLIRVVSQELLSTLDMPLDDLREKNPFTLQIFKVQSLSVSATGTLSTNATGPGTAPAASFTRFVRDGDNWRMDTPFSCPADEDKINKIIIKLDNLNVENFVTGADAADPARTGLVSPTLKIELKGDTSQALWLGKQVPDASEPEYYAKLADSPAVFIVKADDVFTTLLHAQDALRERQFLDFVPENIATISVQFSNLTEVRMEMAENRTWQIVDNKDTSRAPTFIPADTGIIQALLKSLHELSAKSFVSDAPTNDDLQNVYNLKVPEWKVTLQGDKTTKAITLDIGIKPDTTPASPGALPVIHFYAKIEGADSVYEIDNQILDQLSADPLHYRDRTLEELPKGAQIVSLKLTHLNGDDLSAGDDVFNYTVDPAKATWDEFLKDKPQLIKDNVPVVLDGLRQFKVDSYRQAKFDEHYQMDLAQSSAGSMGLTPVPWRYRLDAGVQLTATGGATNTTETLIFYFSDKLKPSLRLGGTRDSPLPPAIFNLPMTFIGALGSITREQTQPAAAVETLRGMDQPINPRVAEPADSTLPTPTPAAPALPPPP